MMKIPINILIVDDERDFVEMLSLRLTDEGHRVRSAFSGQEALTILDETEEGALPETDVVILDIKMPGMDGIDTLKLIKTRHPVVEVILLTGHGAVDTAVVGLNEKGYLQCTLVTISNHAVSNPNRIQCSFRARPFWGFP
jgi:DNA-binding NtrC family response regulator